MGLVSDQVKVETSILTSALAAEVFSNQEADVLIGSLKKRGAEVIGTVKSFNNSSLTRKFNLAKVPVICEDIELNLSRTSVTYKGRSIGRTQVLYKSSLPGELQARLAIESAIDRFLEYLQKVHSIVVLSESDHHVQVFIPSTVEPIDFNQTWENFLKAVAFSDYGKHQLPGLVQTFIVMLNTVTLAGRGFSTLDVPILTQSQANVLAAWYGAVIRDVKKRQNDRQRQIEQLRRTLDNPELSEKDRKSKQKELQDKEAMQAKEAQKYTEYFWKSFVKGLQEQDTIWQELEVIQQQLKKSEIAKTQRNKLQKQQEKLSEKVVLSRDSVQQKLQLLQQTGEDPFKFVEQYETQNPEKFRSIASIVPTFTKTATDQINSTRGDIFTQCISEMCRLLEMEAKNFETMPPPLLTEEHSFSEVRSPGDDSKEFCYSCGVALDPKNARWQVLRFMFERPSQRRQSASGEGRPHICSSCAVLAFASPLKVTEESIILKLKPKDSSVSFDFKIKDYLRMLTNKEMHLSAGRYLVLASDRTSAGDYASQKLGQVQYALAKIASIFPLEVLNDFKFSLVVQGSLVLLENRHLIFTKGLMDCYRQAIVGKEVNMTLGDAVRYIQQDLPFLADYTLAKVSNFSTDLKLEQIRERYWNTFKNDLGDEMDSDNQLSKRARLYQHVAALTGITYAFAQELRRTATKILTQQENPKTKEEEEKIKDRVNREISKLIEEVDDPVAFCYYATLGDEEKISVDARLYFDPKIAFLYCKAQELLLQLGISDREKHENGNTYLQLHSADILQIYNHFADSENYAQEKDWKELTYNLKLSLYTRFPELGRKLKSTSEKN